MRPWPHRPSGRGTSFLSIKGATNPSSPTRPAVRGRVWRRSALGPHTDDDLDCVSTGERTETSTDRGSGHAVTKVAGAGFDQVPPGGRTFAAGPAVAHPRQRGSQPAATASGTRWGRRSEAAARRRAADTPVCLTDIVLRVSSRIGDLRLPLARVPRRPCLPAVRLVVNRAGAAVRRAATRCRCARRRVPRPCRR